MDLVIGASVAGYLVLQEVGRGAMGIVLKVLDQTSGETQAMKILNAASDPEVRDRFLREIRITSRLKGHPNIARMLSAQTIDGELVMLMEFVDGMTLEQRLKQGPLSIYEAVGHARQILSGLGHAHQLEVIHRDVKPSNVLLNKSGAVKVTDFGIAKAAAEHRLTRSGMTLGSLYYMSPEQIVGASSVDHRADLYSLGIVLYEMLSGERPYNGGSEYAIMSAHLMKVPRPLMELANVPESLNRLVMTAINKNPAARFQTAAEFSRELSSIFAGSVGGLGLSRSLLRTPDGASNGYPLPPVSAAAGQSCVHAHACRAEPWWLQSVRGLPMRDRGSGP